MSDKHTIQFRREWMGRKNRSVVFTDCWIQDHYQPYGWCDFASQKAAERHVAKWSM
jgi:hypothetical protein